MAIAKYVKTCSKNIPGNRYQFYLTEIANITSVTETSDEVSAVTLSGLTKFMRATAEIDSIQFKSEGTFNTTGGENQSLVANFGKPSKELNIFIASLKDAIPCGLALIWVDNNAKAWLMGVNAASKDGTSRPVNGLTLSTDSGLTITDAAPASATVVTFTHLSGYAPVPFDSTLTAAILGGTATFIDWT